MHQNHRLKIVDNFVLILFMQLVLEIVDIDDCNPEPCQNNGTCTDLVNDYHCDCVAGFNGTNCDISKHYQCVIFSFYAKDTIHVSLEIFELDFNYFILLFALN